jgi:hypothetical protein
MDGTKLEATLDEEAPEFPLHDDADDHKYDGEGCAPPWLTEDVDVGNRDVDPLSEDDQKSLESARWPRHCVAENTGSIQI